MTGNLHPTALIHPRAELGADCEVGPYAVIEEDVVIGARCWIGAHAVIKRYTRIGDDNRIFEGVVLGGAPQDFRFSGRRSYLGIGHGNTFREGVTVHRAVEEDRQTVIGNLNYFMACCHVAHDCVLHDHIVICNNTLLAGFVHVEDHAFLSGGTVVHQFARLGRHSMIGGNSAASQDVLPFSLVHGNPAVFLGPNSVGLKRAGFSTEDIRLIKVAFRVLAQPGRRLADKLADLSQIGSEHVNQLEAFIRGSTRGFCKFHRAVRDDADRDSMR